MPGKQVTILLAQDFRAGIAENKGSDHLPISLITSLLIGEIEDPK